LAIFSFLPAEEAKAFSFPMTDPQKIEEVKEK
jgi:hypothetical protein